MKRTTKELRSRLLRALVTLVLSLGAAGLCLCGLAWSLPRVGAPKSAARESTDDLRILDRFDMRTNNLISTALEGVLSIDKVYWLNDSDLIAPEPDPEKFGTTKDPSSMAEFLEQARELLGVEDTLFSTETQLYHDSQVTYYLDETIMVITWKERLNNIIYTLSEVKIAHPSQFRRFLADGEFGSDKQYYATQMAADVNAVTASAGDYYIYRPYGIKVYQGQVMSLCRGVDTCYITGDGDMIFSYRGELLDPEAAQQFVDENDVRFSVAFGPVLVDEHRLVPIPADYGVGEVTGWYPRAAICKMEALHYLMVAANSDPDRGLNHVPTMEEFARQLFDFGVEKAYALDGGQTSVIVTNDNLINRPSYGYQRMLSDIIYFATAVPDGG